MKTQQAPVLAARIRRTVANVAVSITQPPPQQQSLAVNLGPCGFAISWAIILFFHLFNATYTLGLAYIYVYLRRPSMDYYVSLIQIMPQWTFKYITILYGTISLLNFKHVFTMVAYSIYYRQLVFKKRVVEKKDVSTTSESVSGHRWCICLPRWLTDNLSRLKRALSVKGHLFDAKLLFREVTEVVSQTYQAYSSSLLVSSVWTNQIFGVIVFLNCIANTAVHIFKEDEVGMRRFLSTVIDLFLDFAWGFIFPGIIIFHYIPSFVRHGYNIPYEYLTSDTLMLEATLDCRHFFVTSWTDAFTTVLPYMSMLTGLSNMKALLQIHESDEHKIKQMSTRAVMPMNDTRPEKTIDTGGSAGPEGHLVSKRIQPLKKPLFERLKFMLIIPIFGLGVLFASIAASGAFGLQQCSSACKLRMRPWFTTKCACSVLDINCFDLSIQGNASELSSIFQTLDDRVLNSLILSHCPAVTMPEAFQRFYALNGLEFYNVTFVDWSREAAITEAAFPTLNYVFVIRSQVGAWPEGLIHDTTPSLADVEISASIIDPIPDDLDERWPSVAMFYFDFCGLQEFPTVLTRMEVTDLSLVGNSISVIPEDLPAVTWMYFYIDRNPLQRLPDRIDIAGLTYFSIQDTGISSLPQWLYNLHGSNPKLHINAYGTDFCDALEENMEPFIRCRINTNTINGGFALVEKDGMRRICPDAPPLAYPKLYEPYLE